MLAVIATAGTKPNIVFSNGNQPCFCSFETAVLLAGPLFSPPSLLIHQRERKERERERGRERERERENRPIWYPSSSFTLFVIVCSKKWLQNGDFVTDRAFDPAPPKTRDFTLLNNPGKYFSVFCALLFNSDDHSTFLPSTVVCLKKCHNHLRAQELSTK